MNAAPFFPSKSAEKREPRRRGRRQNAKERRDFFPYFKSFPDTARRRVQLLSPTLFEMNTPKNAAAVKEEQDKLFRLQRKIAQRADELSRQHGYDRGRALEHWSQAEREVWDTVGNEVIMGTAQLDHAIASTATPGTAAA